MDCATLSFVRPGPGPEARAACAAVLHGRSARSPNQPPPLDTRTNALGAILAIRRARGPERQQSRDQGRLAPGPRGGGRGSRRVQCPAYSSEADPTPRSRWKAPGREQRTPTSGAKPRHSPHANGESDPRRIDPGQTAKADTTLSSQSGASTGRQAEARRCQTFTCADRRGRLLRARTSLRLADPIQTGV